MIRIVLASASPRRADLLSAAGYSFTVRPSRIAEIRAPGEPAARFARRMAVAKARDVSLRLRRKSPATKVLAADTVVVVGRAILGKPRDRSDARLMLRLLSGRRHRVLTAVAVCDAGSARARSACVTTHVTFRRLRPRDIEWYLDSDEPLDKAGAYGIQGLASLFVRSINGSYTNVVGLPMEEVFRMIPPRART